MGASAALASANLLAAIIGQEGDVAGRSRVGRPGRAVHQASEGRCAQRGFLLTRAQGRRDARPRHVVSNAHGGVRCLPAFVGTGERQQAMKSVIPAEADLAFRPRTEADGSIEISGP